MQKMTKEDVNQWCKENNHVIVDITVNKIPPKIVLRIAEEVLEIDDISRKTREEEYVLAKFMVIDYLSDYIPKKKIGKLLNIDRTNVYNGESTRILSKGHTYLKGWQVFAINQFKSKIKEIEEQLYGKKES